MLAPGEHPHQSQASRPLAYLITYHTFGTWLHGDERSSVDRHRNEFETPRLPPSVARHEAEERLRGAPPVELSPEERALVNAAIVGVCVHNTWTLHALNVRTNHVHVVVATDGAPDRAMNAFKSWSTRKVRETFANRRESRLWTRHGSTRWLWDRNDLDGAVVYVRDRQ